MAQHIFFELFSPLKILSVPLGLIAGVAVFVFVYALIVTLVKEEVFYRHQTKKLRKVQFVVKLILGIAGVVIALVLMGNFQ